MKTMTEKSVRLLQISQAMTALEKEIEDIQDSDQDHEIAAKLCPFKVGDVIQGAKNYMSGARFKVLKIENTFRYPFYSMFVNKLKVNGQESVYSSWKNNGDDFKKVG